MNDKEKIRQLVLEIIDERTMDTDTNNQFGVAQIPFHRHNGIDSTLLSFIGLFDTPITYNQNAGKVASVNAAENGIEFRGGYFVIVKDTNGTTNVDVFDEDGAPFALTITGVFVISLDTTAANITVLQGANTVCTIAKGTTSGAMVGATSLSNTVYAKGDVCQVDSSTTGNAKVFITFTT